MEILERNQDKKQLSHELMKDSHSKLAAITALEHALEKDISLFDKKCIPLVLDIVGNGGKSNQHTRLSLAAFKLLAKYYSLQHSIINADYYRNFREFVLLGIKYDLKNDAKNILLNDSLECISTMPDSSIWIKAMAKALLFVYTKITTEKASTILQNWIQNEHHTAALFTSTFLSILKQDEMENVLKSDGWRQIICILVENALVSGNCKFETILLNFSRHFETFDVLGHVLDTFSSQRHSTESLSHFLNIYMEEKNVQIFDWLMLQIQIQESREICCGMDVLINLYKLSPNSFGIKRQIELVALCSSFGNTESRISEKVVDLISRFNPNLILSYIKEKNEPIWKSIIVASMKNHGPWFLLTFTRTIAENIKFELPIAPKNPSEYSKVYKAQEIKWNLDELFEIVESYAKSCNIQTLVHDLLQYMYSSPQDKNAVRFCRAIISRCSTKDEISSVLTHVSEIMKERPVLSNNSDQEHVLQILFSRLCPFLVLKMLPPLDDKLEFESTLKNTVMDCIEMYLDDEFEYDQVGKLASQVYVELPFSWFGSRLFNKLEVAIRSRNEFKVRPYLYATCHLISSKADLLISTDFCASFMPVFYDLLNLVITLEWDNTINGCIECGALLMTSASLSKFESLWIYFDGPLKKSNQVSIMISNMITTSCKKLKNSTGISKLTDPLLKSIEKTHEPIIVMSHLQALFHLGWISDESFWTFQVLGALNEFIQDENGQIASSALKLLALAHEKNALGNTHYQQFCRNAPNLLKREDIQPEIRRLIIGMLKEE